MKNSVTLKSVLNRQCITLGMCRPLASGQFDCRRGVGILAANTTISFKPFERVYRLSTREPELALQAT
jgi:hypothetical protein